MNFLVRRVTDLSLIFCRGSRGRKKGAVSILELWEVLDPTVLYSGGHQGYMMHFQATRGTGPPGIGRDQGWRKVWGLSAHLLSKE